jgi:hypothetical protein
MVFCLTVLLSALGAYGYKLRTDGIFACSAAGYSSDRYLVYCNVSGYGEYDPGAFWFDMEPGVPQAVAAANVVFLGDSRMQHAFSSDVTVDWFAANSITYYLLGFGNYENGVFEGALLQKYSPSAKLYVINADSFFEDVESVHAKALFHDSREAQRYWALRAWQYPHRLLCTPFPGACGHKGAIYRSRESGSWMTKDFVAYNVQPVSEGQPSDTARWPEFIAFAEAFLARLPVERSCVVLTVVPSVHTKRPEVVAIADALQLKLIAPQLEGLKTFDGSHLDKASATRWVTEFFREAGPSIRECAGGSALPLRSTARS